MIESAGWWINHPFWVGIQWHSLQMRRYCAKKGHCTADLDTCPNQECRDQCKMNPGLGMFEPCKIRPNKVLQAPPSNSKAVNSAKFLLEATPIFNPSSAWFHWDSWQFWIMCKCRQANSILNHESSNHSTWAIHIERNRTYPWAYFMYLLNRIYIPYLSPQYPKPLGYGSLGLFLHMQVAVAAACFHHGSIGHHAWNMFYMIRIFSHFFSSMWQHQYLLWGHVLVSHLFFYWCALLYPQTCASSVLPWPEKCGIVIGYVPPSVWFTCITCEAGNLNWTKDFKMAARATICLWFCFN